MNLEEYREWLKENRNYEEAMAYEIAKKLIAHHTQSIDGKPEVQLLPRKIVQTEKERLEFDLIIQISWHSNRDFKRLIGVEFKETDIRKCIQQAVVRRPHVDYMYIATRNVLVDEIDMFRIIDYGIGWVIWSEGFVKLLFGSKMRKRNISHFIRTYTRTVIENTLEEMAKERNKENGLKLLDEFLEVRT